MFTEVIVMVTSPHLFDELETTSVGDPGGGAGTRFVKEMLRVSPGRRRSVGFCKPVGVVKQNNVRPAESTLVK
jgi:hypothetical protein